MKLRYVALGAVLLVSIGQCSDDTEVVPGGRGWTARSDVAPATSAPETSGTGGRREHPASPSPSPSPSADTGADPTTALGALGLLQVKGRAPMTGYDRVRFGPAWLDADRNGCDTRNDVLVQHLRAVGLESNGCVVVAGSYEDPYTGSTIDYSHGHGALIDIDHVVSLGNAWATGAFGWHINKRAAFANDPLNLLPADAGANRQKADGDAATWLPANSSYRCEYVARQVAVKGKYGLWVTPPENAAIQRVLASCDGQALPADDWGASTEVDHNISDPLSEFMDGDDDQGPADSSAAPTAGPPSNGGPAQFDDCDGARAAGAAPVHAGDPGYGRHLDGDGDGVACEP